MDKEVVDNTVVYMFHIFTMEYYSAIKRNIFESVLMRWTNLEPIVQSACVLKKAFCLSNK